MTPKEIFELRKQGHREEAYEAARKLYSVDKGAYAATAMFWTATDVLRLRIEEGRIAEAEKIFLALKRLLPNVPDKEGWVHDTFMKCGEQLNSGEVGVQSVDHRLQKKQTGTWGEELAASYLREKGYIILERDWHSGHRDIDIIAQDGDCIVFIEVKTRRTNDFGSPVVAVNYKKQHHLMRAINHYLCYRHIESFWRFDVISIVGTPDENPEIEHIEGFALNTR